MIPRPFRPARPLVALLLLSCWTPVSVVPGVSPLADRILEVGSGRFVTESELLEHLARRRFVLLGERHDHPEHHRLQARVLRGLAARGRRPAVAFEMLREDLGAVLDSTSPGSPDALRRAVDWDASGWPEFRLYEPVFAAALEARLPIAAADISAETRRRLRGDGIAGLGPELRAALLLDSPTPPELRAALAQDVRSGHCHQLPEALVPRMVEAQLARDANLARALAGAAGAGDGAVLIAGNGHVRSDWAVPWWLRRRAADADVASLAFLEAGPQQRQPGPEAARYDWVWYTEPASTDDPCETFRQQLETLGEGC